MKHITSKLIHGNIENQKDLHRSLKTPIYETNAFSFENSQQIADNFQGNYDAFVYSRVGNPTVAELENRLTEMAGGQGTICTSSGMFAISSALLALCSQGDHIISSPFLFGHSYALLKTTFKDIGIQTTFTDLSDPAAIEEAIQPNTRAIFLENITNPQLMVFDIDAIAAVARKRGVLLVVDNTLLTPYLFPCKDHGVDIEVLSTTKAISGGATTVGGAVIIHESDKWKNVPSLKDLYVKFGKMAYMKKLKKDIFRNLGGGLSPHNAYMQLLGLETLALRTDKACENALQLANHLQSIASVKGIHYPALESSPYKSLVDSQYRGKAGCLVGFELADQNACFAFMDKLKMIRRATNFCDNKSLIIHPYSTIYSEYPPELRDEFQVNQRLIRLSVGIEDIEDIISDIDQALDFSESLNNCI